MASIRKRPDGKWRARYRDPDGREHARHFDRKTDGERWLATVQADIVRGAYVDPSAGKVAFGAFADRWLKAQTFDVLTREGTASRLRVHILPTFAAVELRAIRPSTVQAWLRSRQQTCAPKSVRLMLANLSSILGAAVEDGLITRNPCSSRSVSAPKLEQRRIVPWPAKRVQAVIATHPEPYRAVPVVGAGLGLRQGEVFGLRVDDIDFLRRNVTVGVQVRLVASKPVFAPPKHGKTRDVPLADVVAVALAERLRRFPPVEVTLPWRDVDGPPHTAALVFTSRERKPLNRSYYNPHIWKPALVAAGVEPTRVNGMHALRHHYASVLLDADESIRAVADYLGHADPGFTLRTYTHLMPSSEARARQAVDAALGPPSADHLRTEGASHGETPCSAP